MISFNIRGGGFGFTFIKLQHENTVIDLGLLNESECREFAESLRNYANQIHSETSTDKLQEALEKIEAVHADWQVHDPEKVDSDSFMERVATITEEALEPFKQEAK